MPRVVPVPLALALLLAGAGSAPAANWTVKDGAPGGGGCSVESARQTLNDGYQTTTASIAVGATSVRVTSVSTLDGGFKNIGLTVDREEFIPMDRLEGEKTAVFDSTYDRVVAQFKAGAEVRVRLRFWPTWPATGTHATTFSLIGFTEAYGRLSCR